jgi:hypothetical protein
MPVNDPQAIKFSNLQARVASDLLARAYYQCVAVVERWQELGGDANAVTVMGTQLRNCANAIQAAFKFCFDAEVYWFLGVNSLFPNDTTPVFDNGSMTAQDTNRPLATGAKVNAVMARVIEFQNWLQSATESFTDSARNNRGALDTVYQATSNGTATLLLSDAGNLVNRATELKTNYEANASGNLDSILAFSVNPN